MVRATREMIEAELRDPRELAEMLNVALPGEWPPPESDEASLRWMLGLLQDPGAVEWGMHYFVLRTEDGATLAGNGGYTGPPEDGTVEIGYSVAVELQRRGIATDAVGQLVDLAFERGVITVIANTLPGLEPSIGVLRKLGFTRTEPCRDGVITFALVESAR